MAVAVGVVKVGGVTDDNEVEHLTLVQAMGYPMSFLSSAAPTGHWTWNMWCTVHANSVCTFDHLAYLQPFAVGATVECASVCVCAGVCVSVCVTMLATVRHATGRLLIELLQQHRGDQLRFIGSTCRIALAMYCSGSSHVARMLARMWLECGSNVGSNAGLVLATVAWANYVT